MTARRCLMLAGLFLFLNGWPVVVPFVVSANEELLKLQKDHGQWANQSRDYAATRYSGLNQITPENVKNLKVAWSFSLGTINGQEGGPLVVGDTMYVHSSYSTSNSHNIFALDLSKEGAPIKWKYAAKHDPRAVPVACCDLVHRGLQYANGKILYQTLDGIVIALDAKTGKELWKTRNADPSKGETNTGAGMVVHDKYIVGVAGGEFGVRGWVAAYDINTGKQIWKARSAGPDEDLLLASDFNAANPHYGRFGEGTKSWPGEQWKVGGGTTWGYWSYDPELNLLYYSTGNPGTWNPAPRKGGDNKWSMTIWARNPDTGVAKWAYQMTPWDNWDYDGINESVLTEQTIGGKKLKVLTHFDRNGFVYTLDRTNGTLLSAEPFVYVNWAKGIDLKTGRPIVNPDKLTKQGEDTKNICPSAMGAKSEQPAAYSPKTNFFYAPSNNTCMNYEAVMFQYTAGAPYVGANVLMFNGHEGKDDWWGEVIAWDAVKGKRVWSIKEPFPVQSGPVVTATNVVFYGTMDGWFKAADARDGKLLWKHKVGSGIIGNPITYKGPDGNQYVAVYSGVGGRFGATVALDLPPDDPTALLGTVNAAYLSGLPKATPKGGMMYVFSLPKDRVLKEAKKQVYHLEEGPSPPSQLVWNVWGERSGEWRWTPLPFLKPGTAYRITVDLAAMAYARTGVSSSLIQADFKTIVDQWLRDGVPEVELKLLILHDPAKFERPAVPVSPVKVNLDKVRNLPADATAECNPFTGKNHHPPCLFGRTEFEVRTRSIVGPAALSFSVWVNNRPVEEFSAAFCIADNQATANQQCAGIPVLAYTLKGVDSLRLAAEGGQAPDAALHFVEVEKAIHGVLWRKSVANKFVTWPLDQSPTEFQTYLADTVMPVFFEAGDLQGVGKGFYYMLFPDTNKDGVDARDAFEQFVRSHPRITNPLPTVVAPSIFVRMILPSLGGDLMLPLGLVWVNSDFLGFSFRVELPLPVQTYEPSPTCVSRWVMALPPEPGSPGSEGPLGKALAVFASRIEGAQGWETRGAKVHRTMQPIREWLLKGETDSDPLAFFVVSHHDRNTIYFEDNDKIFSRQIAHHFAPSSIAVLDGCGTGKPGATDFIGELNKHGVAAVIATSTEVTGDMAGQFLACLVKIVDDPDTANRITLAQAAFAAIHCLRDKKSEYSSDSYGGRALAYMLLGNSGLRLCPPEKPT